MADRAAELAKVKADVTAALAAQKKAEAELFAVQKQVGDRLQQNLSLEAQLAEAEAMRASQRTGTAP